jgi:hypothetical protein
VDARIVDSTEAISVAVLGLDSVSAPIVAHTNEPSGSIVIGAGGSRRSYGLGLSADFCCSASAVQGGTMSFTRA